MRRPLLCCPFLSKKRVNVNEQVGFVVWMTGLSGSGKTTLGVMLEDALRARGLRVERLDGDTVRQGLSRDLGFSKADRDRNIERVGFVAKLLARNGVAVICCFISPYRAARDQVRAEVAQFVEVYCDAPVEACAARDVKGLYARAFAGEIPDFTGVNDPYEPPLYPEVTLHTARETPDESLQRLLVALAERGLIPAEVRA